MRGEVGGEPAGSQLRDLFQGARLVEQVRRGSPALSRGEGPLRNPAHRLATGPPALPGRAWTWLGGSEQEFVIRWQAICKPARRPDD